ncbi:MAG: hypothetical protein HY864_03335 [Chloroflexi bacterium]|nr:hypothetical protein [Chloroflexota bacterium]
MNSKKDFLTLIAISAFSAIFATALHEHGGHALACAAQGGKLLELGAFYIDCQYESVTSMGYRFVAFAGPFASLLAGLLGMFLFNRTSRANSQMKFFLWHFATVNLMIATGYFLFSGIIGIGDFGLDQYGVFYQVEPAWLVRVSLTIVGLTAYFGVVLFSMKKMDTFIGGAGQERVNRAQMLSLLSWISGGVAAVLIGFLNPHGIIIVLISSVASCVGGTSGLAWMMQMLNRKKDTGESPFVFERSWAWIGASAAFLMVYAAVFGRTIFL